ncbi:MAG: terpene cyclase/mutase family protein, partial [Kiritimatiellae bacterium]|nr:terpene cyclase/mutase family protein [Kiritimatiellia bacterium]
MKIRMVCLLCVAAPVCVMTAEPVVSAPVLPTHGEAGLEVSESLRREARAAVERGLKWLSARQNEGGHWSNADHPALTALPVWAYVRAGRTESPEVQKAVRYIAGCARDNGAIFVEARPGEGGGLANYNTAISMVALHLAGGPEHAEKVRRARAFIARTQHLGGDIYYGGMGYDEGSGRAYADLSNSYTAYEAMRMTESVEDLRKPGEAKADLDWKAAEQFIQRSQNDARFNTQPWATDDPEDRGGFAYRPDQTRSGTVTNAQGQVKFRSMKGMTYAGLLSYIYADVDRTDPRVEATVDWVALHWGLSSNNSTTGGTEQADTQDDREGLFYLYHVMSKGLQAYGRDVFRPAGRAPFNWRKDLIERLISLQKTDPKDGSGYW